MRCIVLHTFLIFSILRINAGPSGIRRIIGGRDADEDEFPYVVRLQEELIITYNNSILATHRHICTGAVVTPTWTLTAGHCLILKGTIIIKNLILRPVMRHGTWKNSTFTKVMYTIRHPSYKQRAFDLFNDIGLVKSEEIVVKQYARVSALDFVTMIGQEMILSGYGITNNSEGFISDATVLMKPLQLLDVVAVHCDMDYAVMKPAMCVARKCRKSSGVCPGDSGGPVLHPSGIVGVNSLGPIDLSNFCSLKSTKPVYDVATVTPTSPYIDWISDTIKNEVRFLNKTT